MRRVVVTVIVPMKFVEVLVRQGVGPIQLGQLRRGSPLTGPEINDSGIMSPVNQVAPVCYPLVAWRFVDMGGWPAPVSRTRVYESVSSSSPTIGESVNFSGNNTVDCRAFDPPQLEKCA